MKIQELNQFIGKSIKAIRFIDESEKPSTYWFNTVVIDLGANHIKIRCSGLFPILCVDRIHTGSEFHGVEFVNGTVEIFTSAGSVMVFMGDTISVETGISDGLLRDGVEYLVVRAGEKALCVLLHHGDALIGERAVFNGQSPFVPAPWTVVVIASDGSERTWIMPEWEFGTILTYQLTKIAGGYKPTTPDETAAARA